MPMCGNQHIGIFSDSGRVAAFSVGECARLAQVSEIV